MEKDIIMEHLRRISGGAKSKKVKSELAEIDPEYVNQYVDDGSFAFKQLRMRVMEDMAQGLYKSTEPQYLALLTKKDIDDVMKNLRKQRDIEISAKVKEDNEAMKMYNAYAKVGRADRLKKEIAELKKGKKYDVYEQEELKKYLPDVKVKKEPVKPKSSLQALPLVGSGKRKLTPYNKFVKEFAKKHPNLGKKLMEKAGEAWRSRH